MSKMDKDEFLKIKASIGFSYEELAGEIGKSISSLQSYGSGSKIPDSVAIMMRNLAHDSPKPIKKSTGINVRDHKTLTLSEIANICLSQENIEEFLELPVVKAVIELKVMESKLKSKEEEFLKNLKSEK